MAKTTVSALEERVVVLEARHEELLQFNAHLLQKFFELATRVAELEQRPAATPAAAKSAATGAVVMTREERVRRIKILAAKYPQAKSFTPQQIMEVV